MKASQLPKPVLLFPLCLVKSWEGALAAAFVSPNIAEGGSLNMLTCCLFPEVSPHNSFAAVKKAVRRRPGYEDRTCLHTLTIVLRFPLSSILSLFY